MIEAGIQQLVAASSAVQELIGSPARFYPVLLPEDVTWPCASYQVISDVPEYTLQVPSALNQVRAQLSSMRLQIDSWSGGPTNASYATARAIDSAIRGVLDGFIGQLPDGTNAGGILIVDSRALFEQDARAYRISTDYRVWYYPQAGL